jgi:hypothetical protein
MPFVQKNVQFNAAKQRRFNINGGATNRMERGDEENFKNKWVDTFRGGIN